MSAGNALSWQLLRAVLSIYFSITVVVTLAQMGIEYFHTRNMIQTELAGVERTFYPALATALWELNTQQLEALQQGIVDLPLISSVRIVDASGREMTMSTQKSVLGAELTHSFQVTHPFEGNNVHLARITFEAADTVILDRLQLGYKMILVSALIKSTALTLLFIWAFRRRLGEPLGQLTAAVSAIDLDSLGRSRIDLKQVKENELSKLERAFNQMLSALDTERRTHDAHLEELNRNLEAQVIRRTGELAAANQRLEQLVRTDPLTGAANRRHFVEQADSEIQRARRRDAPSLSLLMIDLDNFKKINDTWGHGIGDDVLCNFALIAAQPLRSADLFARVGGEEFAVLLPDTNLEGAKEAAHRIIEATRQQCVVVGDDQVRYTISVGVATLHPHENNYDTLMNRADSALYRAKQLGRNRVEVEPTPTPQAPAQMAEGIA